MLVMKNCSRIVKIHQCQVINPNDEVLFCSSGVDITHQLPLNPILKPRKLQDGAFDSVQVSYKWLISMVYGRYNYT